jgi:1-acyl-sn-glycerol-3-phosphate acyltransferase
MEAVRPPEVPLFTSLVVTRLVSWAVSLYQRVERRGPPLPDGPVLVIANHLNALVDALVIFRTAGRRTRPLAKAPLFEHPVVGPALRGLGGLPIFRPRDDADQVHRNEATFDAAIDALRAGEAIQIYPEGQSHSGPSLTPLKTGAARIAFLAEEGSDWTLGLRVVPVGLVYQRKHRFRGSAVAVYGEPLEVARWRSAYEEDPRAAVRGLTDAFSRSLMRVSLNVPSTRDRELVEVAEALHARAAGKVREREEIPLGRRVGRLRRFAAGLVWLRTADPEAYADLRSRLERYRELQRLLGSDDEAAVPGRYDPLRVGAWGVRRTSFLLLLGAPALAAAAAWSLPYRLTRLVVHALDPKLDAVSTWKLSVALIAFPVTLLGWTLLAWWLGGIGWGLTAFAALPLCGIAWIPWRDALRRTAEDVRVFVRAAPRRSARERLAALRIDLARDIDRVAATLPDEVLDEVV